MAKRTLTATQFKNLLGSTSIEKINAYIDKHNRKKYNCQLPYVTETTIQEHIKLLNGR